jgi:hypothetical protein
MIEEIYVITIENGCGKMGPHHDPRSVILCRDPNVAAAWSWHLREENPEAHIAVGRVPIRTQSPKIRNGNQTLDIQYYE